MNLGWLMDPILLWSGDPDQTLPITSRRLDSWSRFTYADLRGLISDVRHEAQTQGVTSLRVGMLMLGIGEFVNEIVRPPETSTAESSEGALYQERGEWFRRQPQLFPFSPRVTLHGPGLDWRAPLRADPFPLATRPDGVEEGESFAELLAEQWASFASFVGMDLLLLRDETTTPVHSGRIAFDESSRTASRAEVDEWTSALVTATRAIKRMSPQTWLCLYSSGLSPTVETRFGRLDVPRVVAEGMVDAWVDQTWGGAWQDWWDAGWQGWTFQLSNLLARAALIAEGNLARTDRGCRHYPLIQLLDGWEPYDTLHDYPAKLAWGIWAFTHAAVSHGENTISIGGHYLAVANDRTGALIDSDDLRTVIADITAASDSARHRDRTLGPVLVASSADAATVGALSEPPEDAAGFLLKWGLPVLCATTVTLRGATPEGCVRGPGRDDTALETPGSILIASVDELTAVGRRTLGLDLDLAESPMGYSRGFPTQTVGGMRASAWPYMQRRHISKTSNPMSVIYDSAEGPTAMRTDCDALWWFPPTIANGTDRRMTHYQIGSADPHYAVSRASLELRARHGWLSVEPHSIHQPVSVHGWVSRGVLRILLGNLESGWLGDSRYERRVTILVPDEFTRPLGRPILISQHGDEVKVEGAKAEVVVPAESYLVLSLVDQALN